MKVTEDEAEKLHGGALSSGGPKEGDRVNAPPPNDIRRGEAERSEQAV
jgi:hypothetical protein